MKYIIKISLSVVLIFAVTLISSCRKMALIAYKVKQPKIESNESLSRYLSDAGIDDTLLLHIDSASSYKIPTETFNAELPKIEFYNENGEMVTELWESQCSAVLENKFKTLDFDSMDRVTGGRSLAESLSIFGTKDKVKADLNMLKGERATVCMYYSKALGKISTNSLVRWTNGLREHPEYGKLKLLYLNIDMHEDWGIESRKDPRHMKFDY